MILRTRYFLNKLSIMVLSWNLLDVNKVSNCTMFCEVILISHGLHSPMLWKRKGIIHYSITHLMKDLESKVDQQMTWPHPTDVKESGYFWLQVQGSSLCTYQPQWWQWSSGRESETLDEHVDAVATLAMRIELLMTACSSSPESNSPMLVSRSGKESILSSRWYLPGSDNIYEEYIAS